MEQQIDDFWRAFAERAGALYQNPVLPADWALLRSGAPMETYALKLSQGGAVYAQLRLLLDQIAPQVEMMIMPEQIPVLYDIRDLIVERARSRDHAGIVDWSQDLTNFQPVFARATLILTPSGNLSQMPTVDALYSRYEALYSQLAAASRGFCEWLVIKYLPPRRKEPILALAGQVLATTDVQFYTTLRPEPERALPPFDLNYVLSLPLVAMLQGPDAYALLANAFVLYTEQIIGEYHTAYSICNIRLLPPDFARALGVPLTPKPIAELPTALHALLPDHEVCALCTVPSENTTLHDAQYGDATYKLCHYCNGCLERLLRDG